jgi:hypothetical protein
VGTASGEQAYLLELSAYVETLAGELALLVTASRKPVAVPTADGQAIHFRYQEPAPRLIQLLLVIRMVSGLHAAITLLQSGHAIEASVIVRTINDYLGDFIFVDEGLNAESAMTSAQRAFIETYFLEYDDPNKKHINRTQKVGAAKGRKFNPEDPYEVVQLSQNIRKLLDACVHGESGPVMDIYVENTHSGGRFEMLGVSDLSAVAIHRLMLAFHVQMVCATAYELALRLKVDDVAQRLFRLHVALKGRAVFEAL